MKLAEYVVAHTVRGQCRCGNCISVKEGGPEIEGHTINMTFFDLAKTEDADKQEFFDLVNTQFPQWLDGRERSYIETGADIGDQGIALMAMGLGNLLGVWDLMTPEGMLGDIVPESTKQLAAQKGLITIQYRGEEHVH